MVSLYSTPFPNSAGALSSAGILIGLLAAHTGTIEPRPLCKPNELFP